MTSQDLNVLIDALVAELAVPVEVVVVESPLSELSDLPAWSPETEALVAEYVARTGGAR